MARKPNIPKAREKIVEAEDLLAEAANLLADHPAAIDCRHKADDLFELVEELSPEDGV